MGEADDGLRSKRVVFVTVGTTCFDSLVRAVDTQESTGEDGSLSVDYFTFSSSIAEFLKSASLVISHAGSGSIFETLRLRKPLIVVVNEDLMDNHQSELAEELAERKHLFCARPQTLYETISAMDLDSLVAYQPGDATPVAKFINRIGIINMENDQVSEELADWEHVQSPFSTVTANLIVDHENPVTIKDDFYSETSVFPPGNHEDLPVTPPQDDDKRLQEPEPVNLHLPLDGLRKWKRLRLGVIQTGISHVAVIKFCRDEFAISCRDELMHAERQQQQGEPNARH
ncbi:UNVERIFIED_CONTAM: UDP-N-acetylglucosamine transferase subunit ALG13 [Sesamum latifolium]|uniref:UDP-N-acetylglucosamine transferase subunit ALG13 n=1 Tax=Sesamum latifolium TaxID=2727402 RepID=A0AAW2UWJ9_9LAMI